MDINFLLAGVLFLAGWLWSYLFLKQFIYNFTVAFPLVNGMLKASDQIISPNARKFTWVSVIANFLVCGVICFLILWFVKPLYLRLCFIAGAVIAFVMIIKGLSYKNRKMFDSFCSSYYRFVPDDELRTAMFNKKPSQMKVRLHALELPYEWIPKFESED